MGSGKRKYRKRATKPLFGRFKPERDDKPKNPEDVKRLIEWWNSIKEKKKWYLKYWEDMYECFDYLKWGVSLNEWRL